jgi:aminopeptidase N
LVAHEMAHQWFGDYTTLSSWHDIWLNEGFATYMTGLVYENLLNGFYWPIWKNQQIQRITSSTGGSVYVADTTNILRIFDSRLSYSKGAYLLHMLRWEMGDERFFTGLKSYLNDPSIANGFASQEKFVKHMEAAADTTFTEFFNDWYYGEGYPVFRLTYFPDPSNQNRQILRVNQIPSHPSVSFFEMHLPVRVWSNNNYKDLRLYNTQQNQEFVISEQRIDSIQFDPEKWLCSKADIALPTQEISKPTQIQIIPEFSTNRIRIILPEFSGKETYRISDLNGRIILVGLLARADSWIDIKNLKNGIYLVEVKSNDRKLVEKIIVSN